METIINSNLLMSKFLKWFHECDRCKHFLCGLCIGAIAIFINTLIGKLVCLILIILLLRGKDILFKKYNCQWCNCILTTFGGFIGGIIASVITALLIL